MVRAMRITAVAALAAAGCARPPAPGPWAEPAPSTEATVDAIRARTLSAERLQASLELSWEDPESPEPQGCSAFLVFDRAEGMRVLARSVAFVTVFELVADPFQVWLDVPRERLTVTAARNDPDWSRLPASPEALLVALFADPWAGREEPGTCRWEGDGVLRGDGWVLHVDPVSALPSRYEAGELAVEWGEWAPRRGVLWPHRADIHAAGGTLRVRLGRLITGRTGSPGQFVFEPPEDRERIGPAEAADRWETALEGLSGP
jgi:hypothetical protein